MIEVTMLDGDRRVIADGDYTQTHNGKLMVFHKLGCLGRVKLAEFNWDCVRFWQVREPKASPTAQMEAEQRYAG